MSFDTSFLLAAAEPSLVLDGEEVGCSPELARSRFVGLLKELETNKTTIVVSTLVVAEVMVKRTKDRQRLLDAMRRSARIEIASFGEASALELADIFARNWTAKQGLKILTKSKFKFDMQIVATAKASRVDRLYTTDRSMKALATREGLAVSGFDDLPDPNPVQRQLFLEADPAPQVIAPPA